MAAVHGSIHLDKDSTFSWWRINEEAWSLNVDLSMSVIFHTRQEVEDAMAALANIHADMVEKGDENV